jgi:hypothetical protein
MIFGSRSERYVPTNADVIQHTLFPSDAVVETPVEMQKISYEKKKPV